MIRYNEYTKKALQNKINPLLAKINITLAKPTSIHFSITHKCSLSCKHCDIWKTKNSRRELNTQEIKKIINNLKAWLGPFSLNIAGGEPFIRKDIIEIIEYCTTKGIETNITTNGTLINKNLAEKILNSGLKTINISLDSISPKFHNNLRNNKSTFKKVISAIKYLNTDDRKLCIVIATVLMKQNCKEIENLMMFTKQNKLNGIILQPLFQNFGTSYNPNWYKNSEFWPHDTQIMNKVLIKLIEHKNRPRGFPLINSKKQFHLFKSYFKNPNQKTTLKCAVGLKNFCINEYGDALLCFWLPPIGNLLKEKPKTLWCSAEAKKRRIQIKDCNRNCKLLNCHFD